MIRIICGFLLLWLSFAQPAQAQMAFPPKPIPEGSGHWFDDEIYRWWWGYSPTQVHDKVLSEPGWRVNPLEQDEFQDPDFMVMTAQSTADGVSSVNDVVVLYFSFYKNQLYKRAYAFRRSNAIIKVWDEELKAFPYDDRNSYWADAPHHTQIRRSYFEGGVLYKAEEYFEPHETKVTTSPKK